MKLGKQTIVFENRPIILESASVVGPKEKEGPLSEFFDTAIDDVYFGEDTFEKAESKLIGEAAGILIRKANLEFNDIDYMFAGDLLNQCISSSYAARNLNIPFFRTIRSLFNICRGEHISCRVC